MSSVALLCFGLESGYSESRWTLSAHHYTRPEGGALEGDQEGHAATDGDSKGPPHERSASSKRPPRRKVEDRSKVRPAEGGAENSGGSEARTTETVPSAALPAPPPEA